MGSAAVAERIGYRFRDPALLDQALTHRSFSASHNERLEFLGDGVLNCVIATELYRRFPELPEGDLSRLRAHLVNQAALAGIAEALEVGPALRLGEGEMRSGGVRRPSILADAFEAILGAVFLDGGFAAVHGLVAELYAELLEGADPAVLGKDAKTQLQELLQGRRVALPLYEVVAVRGQAHDQTFEVECRIPALEICTTGTGRSRRAAEQEAAARACALAAGL